MARLCAQAVPAADLAQLGACVALLAGIEAGLFELVMRDGFHHAAHQSVNPLLGLDHVIGKAARGHARARRHHCGTGSPGEAARPGRDGARDQPDELQNYETNPESRP